MKSQIKAGYMPRKPHHIIIKLQKKITVKAARGNIYLQRNNNGTRLNDWLFSRNFRSYKTVKTLLRVLKGNNYQSPKLKQWKYT